MGLEIFINRGAISPTLTREFQPGFLSKDEVVKSIKEINSTRRGWPDYTLATREDARIILGLGQEDLTTLASRAPFGPKYWLDADDVLWLQKEHEETVGIDTYFSGRISYTRLPSKGKHAGNSFSTTQRNLYHEYRRRNPTVQALFEINHALVFSLEKYYFQSKSKTTILQESNNELTAGLLNWYLMLGRHALASLQQN